MKLPSKIRSIIDEMGLKSPEKTKVLRHLNDMADSLPEHPTPAEAKRIVGGALKSLKITVGGDDDSSKEKDDEPKKKEKKEEPKEDKPKEEKKEKVAESKMTFKAFLGEAQEEVTIDITLVPEDEENFVALTADFKKIKFGKPQHGSGRKMVATATGTKKDLLNFLSSDDGAGYSFEFIKKTWPQIVTGKV